EGREHCRGLLRLDESPCDRLAATQHSHPLLVRTRLAAGCGCGCLRCGLRLARRGLWGLGGRLTAAGGEMRDQVVPRDTPTGTGALHLTEVDGMLLSHAANGGRGASGAVLPGRWLLGGRLLRGGG